MALDPSIILGVKPAQFESPVNQLAKVLQIQEAQQMNQARSMQMEDAQNTRQTQNRLTSLLSQYGDAPDLPEQLTRGGFIDQANTIRKGRLDASKAEADIGKTKADTEKANIQAARERVEILWNAASGAKDQPSYAQALQMLQSQGIDVSGAPPQYDPAFVENAKQQALTQAQRLEQVWKQNGYDLDVSKFKESQRHNKTQEGISAGQLAVSRGNLSLRQQEFSEGNRRFAAGLGSDGKPLKPLTEGQAKAVAFASRMEASNNTIADLAKKGVNASVPGSRAPLGIGDVISAVQPADRQMLDQAKRDFINAILRRESGAVISDAEFANAERQYFPQLGDAKQVMEQKARNRRIAIDGMRADVPQDRQSVVDEISSGGQSQQQAPQGFKIIGVK
jgi:hypothetical protein